MYSISKTNWDKLNSLVDSQVAYNGRRYIAKSWQVSKEFGIVFLCVATWWEAETISGTPIPKKDMRFFNLQTIMTGSL